MMRKWMLLVAVLGVLSPVITHGANAKVVLVGPVSVVTGFYEDGGRWRSDSSTATHYLALNYSYNGTNITLNSATSFESFKEGGVKKYTKRAYTLKEVNLVAVKGIKAGFSIHLEDADASEANVFQGVFSGPMSQGVISSLSGAGTFLSWDKPLVNLGDMYDVRYSLQRNINLKTAASVEASLLSQGYILLVQ